MVDERDSARRLKRILKREEDWIDSVSTSYEYSNIENTNTNVAKRFFTYTTWIQEEINRVDIVKDVDYFFFMDAYSLQSVNFKKLKKTLLKLEK